MRDMRSRIARADIEAEISEAIKVVYVTRASAPDGIC